MNRRSFVKGAVVAAGRSFVPVATAAPASMREIVPGVWFRAGDFLASGQANNVIIEMRDYLVIVDANTVSGAQALAAEVKSLSSKPVKYVLLTHHHGDHIYGNALWTRAGATTIAHHSMLSELARIEPSRWRREAARNEAMAALGDAPQPPRQTFSEDIWTLDDGSRRIEAHYFGGAHTRDDIVVYLPLEQVLCSGDVAIHTSLNSFFDSDFTNWPVVLQIAARLRIEHVLPGHGEPGGKSMLGLQEQFLTALGKAALAANANGQKPADAAAAMRFPAELRPWVGPSLPKQLAQVRACLPPK